MIDKKIMMEEIRSLISEGYTVEITAKGYSMNPFIMHLRDIIVLGPWKDEEIRKQNMKSMQRKEENKKDFMNEIDKIDKEMENGNDRFLFKD